MAPVSVPTMMAPPPTVWGSPLMKPHHSPRVQGGSLYATPAIPAPMSATDTVLSTVSTTGAATEDVQSGGVALRGSESLSERGVGGGAAGEGVGAARANEDAGPSLRLRPGGSSALEPRRELGREVRGRRLDPAASPRRVVDEAVLAWGKQAGGVRMGRRQDHLLRRTTRVGPSVARHRGGGVHGAQQRADGDQPQSSVLGRVLARAAREPTGSAAPARGRRGCRPADEQESRENDHGGVERRRQVRGRAVGWGGCRDFSALFRGRGRPGPPGEDPGASRCCQDEGDRAADCEDRSGLSRTATPCSQYKQLRRCP